MKTTLSLLSALLCISAPQLLQAAGNRVDNVQPKFALLGSPEIGASIRGLTAAKRPRVPAPGEPIPVWLEFETDFDAVDEFPEVAFRFSLLLKNSTSVKLLEGELNLIDVARGKDRHSVMYIAPKTLNRLAEGKPFTPNMIQAIWVEVSPPGQPSPDQLLGLGIKVFHGVTKEQVTQLIKDKDNPNVKIERVKDAFIPKGQTPFAPLFWDYYEAVKPIAR